MYRLSAIAVATFWAGSAVAEAPNVATDIAPVHSLVAQVMEGVGSPALIIRPGASPHGYSMRPSEAQNLQSADLVVWMGESLTSWMTKPLETLAGQAAQMELLEQDGMTLHDFRDLAEITAGEHDDHANESHEGHDEHDEDHAEHDEAEEDHGHDEHGHDHEHGDVDPHAWLDPHNAGQYRSNADLARQRLSDLENQTATRLAPLKDARFITFHDAYQYYEKRFSLMPAGTISLTDASAPGPARLAHLREQIEAAGVSCAFTEPQFNTGLIEAAIDGMPVRIHVLDPIGAGLEPGPDLYARLITDMTDSFADCAEQR